MALFLVLPACTTGLATPPVSQVSSSAISTTTTATTLAIATTTTSPTPSTTTTSDPADPPAEATALITTTGVVVAILEHLSTGYRVRTPCGNEVLVDGGSEIGPIAVVLDPGHGGAPDPGAVGANGLKEATINLNVAVRAQEILKARGIATVLTRTSDYASPLGVRAQLADSIGPSLMLSIHHNAPTGSTRSEPGSEVFVQAGNVDSRRLGQLVYGHVVDALSVFDGIAWSAAPDAGVLEVLNTRGTDAYGMLRNPETVTALAELAYISHPTEAELMTTPRYVRVAAQAVADAITAYLSTNDQGRGYVETPRVFDPQKGISAGVCDDPVLEG
jgi:N-acetylmuramoyl-L-alanine amidase